MKKYICCLIVGLVVCSGYSVFAEPALRRSSDRRVSTIVDEVAFSSSFTVVDRADQYCQLQMKTEECYLTNPGQPLLPRLLRKYEIPFGASDIQIEVTPEGYSSSPLEKDIVPMSPPVAKSLRHVSSYQPRRDPQIYSQDGWYPAECSRSHVGVGVNAEGAHVSFVTLNLYPIQYNPVQQKIQSVSSFDIYITYSMPDDYPFPLDSTYDLVVITPQTFSRQIQKLIDHKERMGMPSIMKTTEEIYKEFLGQDKPEQIKYFIKYALEEWGVSYVLLFGGLKSILYAQPKDDLNQGSRWWHVPVRYSNFQYDGNDDFNFTSGEPGYLCDLYYADIYGNGGSFESWDSNNNGIYAEWSGDLYDELDLYPDVAIGRLAVRNRREARDVVNKIIRYEQAPADPSWFNQILAVSGDGFLDQRDWNILWDTTGLKTGEYTIHARTTNAEDEQGPIDAVSVTVDKTQQSTITFNHDDHLNPGLADGYPAPPIAEIVSVSDTNIMGNTDVTYTPSDGEAYCNELYWWANISYVDEQLTIRGKCYDPQPYGVTTDLEVWITDAEDHIIFSENQSNHETYYEGEWLVGEELLLGRGGALAYMPETFASTSLFASNGLWEDQSDVIEEFSKGYGFVYVNGHGSPGWWGDHLPGIPGNRRYSLIPGLTVTQFTPSFPFVNLPAFPMRKLTNTDKLPVVTIGGCHNSMYSVSLIPSVLDLFLPLWMFTYGTPTPECWGWYLIKLPRTGAIATMGSTGYSWGSEGEVCTIGTGDGWINTEFYRQYGQENQTILGDTYRESITSYIDNHMIFEYEYWRHDKGWDGIDQKTVQQWQLLGDPSLQMGGYP